MASNKEAIINGFIESGMTEAEANEAYLQQLRDRASNGGKKSSPTKGFAHPTHQPSRYGTIGGKKSRRFKKPLGSSTV